MVVSGKWVNTADVGRRIQETQAAEATEPQRVGLTLMSRKCRVLGEAILGTRNLLLQLEKPMRSF